MIPRSAVFPERRESNRFGAQDDFHSIVQRRLVALQYLANDQGAIVDSSGNIIVDAGDTAGTGQTPSQLMAIGYTPDQVAVLAGSVAGNTSGASGALAISGGSTAPGSSNASWISGIGSAFASIGTTLTNVTRAAKSPTINPATGLPYGINPQTGQPFPVAAQNSLLLIVVLAVLVWAVFKG